MTTLCSTKGFLSEEGLTDRAVPRDDEESSAKELVTVSLS